MASEPSSSKKAKLDTVADIKADESDSDEPDQIQEDSNRDVQSKLLKF